ncbi:sulfatase-like hydrolase/transferase [Hyphococcus luteus]|uniref:sulfatase-like hydrolase/transferase n=1 Tax=Hyphococcus luteus TaxID=2058213 RepID=UPI0013FDB749|nr:sulfatase-like hydrolase/transferase [Marinicaulis flavus]
MLNLPFLTRFFAATILIAGACAPTAGTENAQERTPPAEPYNIVLIVADDLGVNDVGYNGNPAIATPRLDALATHGAVFRNAYASSPVCATSRAGLLTGVYQQRFGMESNPSPRRLAARTVLDDPGAEMAPEVLGDPPHEERGLPPEAVTIAERLKDAGYKTAHIGKWHLGSADGYTPNDQGYDEFYGFLGGASMFAERDDPDVVGAQLEWNGLDNFLWERLSYSLQRNGESQPERPYQTDAFGAAARDFISKAGGAPFFLSIAFNAPHNPLQAPKDLVAQQPEALPHRNRVYYAMIESLDRNIGVVMDELERTGLRDRTIVIVTSDNGGAAYIRIDDVNSPFRGFKANFWEGGVRVPLVVDVPGAAPADVDEPVSLLDLAPMIFNAAGVEAERLDGHSPLAATAGPRTLAWRNNTLSAVRRGDWKLIRDAKRDRNWLYNLKKDPEEHHNLAETRPDMVAKLTAEYERATADWPTKPAWGPTYYLPVHADPVENPIEAENDDWTYWPG